MAEGGQTGRHSKGKKWDETQVMVFTHSRKEGTRGCRVLLLFLLSCSELVGLSGKAKASIRFGYRITLARSDDYGSADSYTIGRNEFSFSPL